MGQYQTFILYIYIILQLRDNFWEGPLFKDVLFENGAKSHNFTNLFFVTSHFGTLFNTNEIQIPYNKHHKVSLLVKSPLNTQFSQI